MKPINLLYCVDRSADYSNRRSYLLLRRARRKRIGALRGGQHKRGKLQCQADSFDAADLAVV